MTTGPTPHADTGTDTDALAAEISLLERAIEVVANPPAPRVDPTLSMVIDRALDALEQAIERRGPAGKAKGNPHHDKSGHFTDAGHEGHATRKPREGRKPRKPGHDQKNAAAKRERLTERPKPSRGDMVAATRAGDGKNARIVRADGAPVPAHIQPAMVAPAWTDVKISVDPRAEVLVTARDAKGRPKMVLSKSYESRAAAMKFHRVSEMIDKHDQISREIQAARAKPETREEADCSWLMQVQATRPGSNADTKAKVKAYGATTLEARHVVQSEDGVRLQFIGKEGVAHNHLVRDPELAKMLTARAQAAGSPDGKLFHTTDTKVRDFVASLDGGDYSPKDFRTSAATRMAREAVAADPERSPSQKAHTVRVKAVAERVSRLLGNRPAQALTSYIHPAVFEPWNPS